MYYNCWLEEDPVIIQDVLFENRYNNSHGELVFSLASSHLFININ